MKTYLKFAIIFASIISPTWADDFSCEVKLGPDNTIYVDVQNTSNSDIVIMGGRDEKLVIFGILYYPVLDEGMPKIITIGENLGMYEIPDLIFLPAKYTRRFQVDLPGLKDIKQIVHLRIRIRRLSYDKFSKLTKETERDPQYLQWEDYETDLIRDSKRLEKINMSYGFGHGLSGYLTPHVSK